MTYENYEFLSAQMLKTGFGTEHQQELKANMGEGNPAFLMTHIKEYGKDSVVASLHFRKSDEKDNYFFNKYDLQLKKGASDEQNQQTFYIIYKQDNISLKEAYNLMSGRAVYKEFKTSQGEKYNAWTEFNFNDKDNHGQYKQEKFGSRYGFDLNKELNKLPLKEMDPASDPRRLIEGLERGNQQKATYVHDGKEINIFIQAAPKERSLKLFDSNLHPTNAEKLTGREQLTAENKITSAEQHGAQSEKVDAKKNMSHKTADDEEASPGRKQSKRKGMGM